MSLGLGYAIRLTDRFSAGVHLHYVEETIWHSSLTAFSVDVGTLYRLTADGLYLGASLSNFGTKGRYSGSDLRIRFDNDPATYGDNSNLPAEVFTEEFSLPIQFRVGLSYPVLHSEHHRILVAADAIHPSDNTESVSLGAEWTFDGLVSLRGGYQQLFKRSSEVGLTLGAGISYDLLGWMVRVDYAWADHGRLSDTQRFSVGFQF
jgi:opacity protein-like surface antigen